jgi:hypothetical protein
MAQPQFSNNTSDNALHWYLSRAAGWLSGGRQGLGVLETRNMMSLEQIVVDDEIARVCQRLRDGVDTSAEKDCIADIADYPATWLLSWEPLCEKWMARHEL